MANNFLILPDEILLNIFNKLSINQIVVSKLVCKRWYFVLNKLRIRNLVISIHANLPNHKYWLTYNFVNCTHLIRDAFEKSDRNEVNKLISLESINNKLNQRLFDNLRSLYVYNIYHKNLFTSYLNKFTHLERLEFIYSRLKNEAVSNCTLNLDNLKILHISDAINDVFVLNTPRLSNIKLNISNLEKVTFNYPDQVRLFETLRYNDVIKIFSNLEYLFAKNINDLDDDFLLQLPHLKELHFDSQKRIFHILQHQKSLFKRNELKLFYFGLNLENIPNYNLKNTRNQLNDKAVELLGDNYEKIATVLPFVHQIDYCDLESYFNNKIPYCFIKRFVNLDYLLVTSKVKDPDQLNSVLKDCNNLKSLTICSALDQNFYDTLPSILPYLEYLSITNEQKIHFEFILNFKILELIYIKQNLSEDLIWKILNRFKDLIYKFAFSYQSTNMEINNREFKLKIGENQLLSFSSIDELFSGLKLEMQSMNSIE